MNITTKLLRELDACPDGVGAFLAAFPGGEATWAECVEAAKTE